VAHFEVGAGKDPKRTFSMWSLLNHPPRDPLRDPAALLTQEGNLLVLNSGSDTIGASIPDFLAIVYAFQ
jgi:hypothetical protein